PASRMYATLRDVHNLLPKIVPDFIKSYELVEGDGGVGTIRKITFGPLVSKEPTVATEKVLAVDDAAKSVTYSLIEGDLTKLYSQFVATTKYVDGADDGSSTAIWSVEYEPIGDSPAPEQAKEAVLGSMKAVEGYLLA
ncbi:hypothetical protein SELMODRAFT_18100, partial [Selaginella moellendorffii]